MNFSLSNGLGGSDGSRSVLAHRDYGSRSDFRPVVIAGWFLVGQSEVGVVLLG